MDVKFRANDLPWTPELYLPAQGLVGRLAGVQPVSGQQRGQRGQRPGPLPVGLRRAEQAFGGTAADDAEHRARLAVIQDVAAQEPATASP